jgi:hypothetical protein
MADKVQNWTWRVGYAAGQVSRRRLALLGNLPAGESLARAFLYCRVSSPGCRRASGPAASRAHFKASIWSGGLKHPTPVAAGESNSCLQTRQRPTPYGRLRQMFWLSARGQPSCVREQRGPHARECSTWSRSFCVSRRLSSQVPVGTAATSPLPLPACPYRTRIRVFGSGLLTDSKSPRRQRSGRSGAAAKADAPLKPQSLMGTARTRARGRSARRSSPFTDKQRLRSSPFRCRVESGI